MATAQEALARMAQLGFHQLMVTREGRLVGVVSERDLFALQRVTMRNVLQSTRLARDVAGLKRVVADIESLTDNLIAQGAAAEPLTHTITSLNDALTQRAVRPAAAGVRARRDSSGAGCRSAARGGASRPW